MRLDGPLTVAVDGYLEPATLPTLKALDVLWQTVRVLPMDACQRRGMELMFGSGSAVDLERWMGDDAVTDLTIGLTDGSRAIVRVRHSDGLTVAQRIVNRYTVEQLLNDRRHRDPWVIRDSQTGDLVSAGAGGLRPLEFAIRESAEAWVLGRANLAQYRVLPGGAVGR
ncbi:hypothetical protein ACIRST_03935 [Kitasatospora sp. NPDC101447]|uniref:hypothetical protein n=1 Tax=Kitasatospora sp. NPDC101447 TaxID=3364102 RepID=UPI0038191F2B